MATDWLVHRTLSLRPDGQRRWDLAYQLLAQWTREHDRQRVLPPAAPQEVTDGNRALCSRLDPPSSPDPDH